MSAFRSFADVPPQNTLMHTHTHTVCTFAYTNAHTFTLITLSNGGTTETFHAIDVGRAEHAMTISPSKADGNVFRHAPACPTWTSCFGATEVVFVFVVAVVVDVVFFVVVVNVVVVVIVVGAGVGAGVISTTMYLVSVEMVGVAITRDDASTLIFSKPAAVNSVSKADTSADWNAVLVIDATVGLLAKASASELEILIV